MNLSFDETIAALASPPGAASRGIVRVSGATVHRLLDGWFDPIDRETWKTAPFAAVHSGLLKLCDSRTAIPVEVHLWPNRRSYTGQPLVELHLPGSPPLLEAVLSEVYRQGARPARPGEFTLRAFLAGKLDLLQAEAVLGVIDAHDHTELQTALAQLAGGLSGRLVELRRDLLELLADLEAGLDFIEEDIEFVSRCDLTARLAVAHRFVEGLLHQTSDRMQTRARQRVVLAGLPNAGKSTLFNRLAGQQAALVSSRQGTTRDALTAPVDWHGLAFDLVDTAGWESESTGIIEAAQKQRAAQLREADVLVWLSSASLEVPDRTLDERLLADAASTSRNVLRVTTQIDRRPAVASAPTADPTASELDSSMEAALRMEVPVAISAVTGAGLDELENALQHRLSEARGPARQWLGMTAARCRESLESVAAALARAEVAAGFESVGDELLAVDVREALDHLGHMLGVVYTDDILDRVFSKFCIGK